MPRPGAVNFFLAIILIPQGGETVSLQDRCPWSKETRVQHRPKQKTQLKTVFVVYASFFPCTEKT